MDQISSEALQFVVVPVEETDAQCAHASHSPVIGSGTADRNGNIPVSAVQSVQNQLTRSEAGGVHRIAEMLRHQRQSRSGSHFNDCFALTDDAVTGSDRMHQRVVNLCFRNPTVFSGNYRVNGAFASIGDLDRTAFTVFKYRFRRFFKQESSLFACQAAFECVTCE